LTADQILATEFSPQFVELMKNRMVVSYYKYGPVADNYKEQPSLIDCIASLQKRIAKYLETGNTEFLVDAGNLCMIEYMFPQHAKAHFRATDSSESPGLVGMSIRELEKAGEQS
jgi:hypothetical protein